MKSVLSLCVVLAVAVLAVSAEVEPITNNLSLGNRRPTDRLLFSRSVDVPPRMGQVLREVVEYNGNGRITAIYANHLRSPQNTRVSLIGGGIGSNFAQLQFLSAPGMGIYYGVQIWGI